MRNKKELHKKYWACIYQFNKMKDKYDELNKYKGTVKKRRVLWDKMTLKAGEVNGLGWALKIKGHSLLVPKIK